MARRPEPRHITLGGHEAVALTVEEYEQLIASRRQIGGQSARVRVLSQQAKRTEQLLRELESLVEEGAVCRQRAGETAAKCSPACQEGEAGQPDEGADCLRCALADLLRRHRDLTS